jgi:Rrf2 family transcriptional regulator, repressor of oqxAB
MAAHALALLARTGGGRSSGLLAASVNTHAVFLRRILRDLVAAGLVEAREGRSGGYRLARPASRVTLADVYRAVEPEGPLSPSPSEPDGSCPIGAGMREAFGETAAAAERGLLGALRGRTLAELARTAERKGRGRRSKRQRRARQGASARRAAGQRAGAAPRASSAAPG